MHICMFCFHALFCSTERVEEPKVVLKALLTHIYVCVCDYVCFVRSGVEHLGNDGFLLRLLSVRHQIHPRFGASQRLTK